VYWNREFQLQQQGFDFTYDKRLLDHLHAGDVRQASGHLQADAPYSARLARFLENHDEARSATAFGHRLRAAAALSFTLPGLRFFFDGQLEGAHARPPVQLGRWPDDLDRFDIRDLYARLLKTIDQAVFHDGGWTLLDTPDSHLIACAWRTLMASGQVGEMAVIVANVTTHFTEGVVRLGGLPEGDAFDLVDRLSDQTLTSTREDLLDGLHVRLRSGDAHLFLIKPA